MQFEKASLRWEPRSEGASRKTKACDIYPMWLEGAKHLYMRVNLPVAEARIMAAKVSRHLDILLASTVPDTGKEERADD